VQCPDFTGQVAYGLNGDFDDGHESGFRDAR
jgi:DUF971 family protein